MGGGSVVVVVVVVVVLSVVSSFVFISLGKRELVILL